MSEQKPAAFEGIKADSLDGEPGRSIFVIGGVDRSLHGGRNSYFESIQRNKRAIAVDLKTPEVI